MPLFFKFQEHDSLMKQRRALSKSYAPQRMSEILNQLPRSPSPAKIWGKQRRFPSQVNELELQLTHLKKVRDRISQNDFQEQIKQALNRIDHLKQIVSNAKPNIEPQGIDTFDKGLYYTMAQAPVSDRALIQRRLEAIKRAMETFKAK